MPSFLSANIFLRTPGKIRFLPVRKQPNVSAPFFRALPPPRDNLRVEFYGHTKPFAACDRNPNSPPDLRAAYDVMSSDEAREMRRENR